MARQDKGIWIEGERELYLNMQRVMGSNISAARKSLRKAGMLIVKDAVQNLRNGGHWATGQLAKSGKVQKVEGDEDAVDVGFFSNEGTGGYAAYVEYGRKAGKMPPVHMLEQWLKKKTSTRPKVKNAFASAARFVNKSAEAYRRSIAWAIARSIAKHGTNPHPFFAPAVDKNKDAIAQAIQEAIQEDNR